mmetsp:Transcript_40922/g.88662  ORF Transcript_40922/g.88662 Transcript_40922/m.88662 type:complete len:221 (+) Transcript_40922:414-1076(+)
MGSSSTRSSDDVRGAEGSEPAAWSLAARPARCLACELPGAEPGAEGQGDPGAIGSPSTLSGHLRKHRRGCHGRGGPTRLGRVDYPRHGTLGRLQRASARIGPEQPGLHSISPWRQAVVPPPAVSGNKQRRGTQQGPLWSSGHGECVAAHFSNESMALRRPQHLYHVGLGREPREPPRATQCCGPGRHFVPSARPALCGEVDGTPATRQTEFASRKISRDR